MRELAMRRAPGLDNFEGEVGGVEATRVPPARTSARFDVKLTVGENLNLLLFSPNALVTVARVHVQMTSEIGALVFAY
ncbi:jg12850 [Pararge aegeria aegeria]|uniref:Jg12850 protein n=1 Tax=Pararge aegeria aegeria TaxID=348720 RepID=A0A8S4S9P8_9NEOP|nr:jg12850 [Pararge aegeria aegeria]